jgi:hypothetical protein
MGEKQIIKVSHRHSATWQELGLCVGTVICVCLFRYRIPWASVYLEKLESFSGSETTLYPIQITLKCFP